MATRQIDPESIAETRLWISSLERLKQRFANAADEFQHLRDNRTLDLLLLHRSKDLVDPSHRQTLRYLSKDAGDDFVQERVGDDCNSILHCVRSVQPFGESATRELFFTMWGSSSALEHEPSHKDAPHTDILWTRWERLMRDAGYSLFESPPGIQARFSEQINNSRSDGSGVVCDDWEENAWIWSLFDVAWSQPKGSIIRAERRLYVPDSFDLPYDRDVVQLWARSEDRGFNASAKQALLSWSETLPDFYYSKLQDVYNSSMYFIDWLIAQVKPTGLLSHTNRMIVAGGMTAFKPGEAPPSSDRLPTARINQVTTPRPDVLLVTVNEHETRAVQEAFEAATGVSATTVTLDGRVYRNLGTLNSTTVYHALSEMGSSSIGGMHQTIDKSIRALDPGAVIAIGVAFGLNEKKQTIGDILLSSQLRPYELQRVGSDVVLRGSKPDATARLVNHFKSFAQTAWRGATVRSGVILTGDKLIDNIDYRNRLLAFEPEAVGGEMEGAGLYVPCQEHKVDWIVIKAICDWADGDKSINKTERQKEAAKNAVQFFIQALQNSPLKRLK